MTVDTPTENDIRCLLQAWETETGKKVFHSRAECYQETFRKMGPWVMLFKAVEPLHQAGQHVNCVACLAVERIKRDQ